MLWPGMRFSLRSQCKRCSTGRLHVQHWFQCFQRVICTRDEHWTGLGLDWIWNIANFVEFGLDPDCRTLQNLGSGPDLDLVNGKEMRHFSCEKAALFNFFGLHLDLVFTFEKLFGLLLDLD